MIEFITLFLGLVSGLQTIEVSVTEQVARVELLLDGAAVATLEKEPWRVEVDLGKALRPHVLEAVAFGHEGVEVCRTEQILNVAQSRAMLRIILGKPQDDGTRDSRLVWLSADNTKPVRVAVTLDGEPLEVVARRAFELPFVELQSDAVHMINAQADFATGEVATATVLLGGKFGDQVTSQLTAVPVVLAAGTELPPLEQLSSWLKKDGEPLEVMAVEKRGAQVVAVRDRSALGPLTYLAYRFREQRHRQIGKLNAHQAIRLLQPTPVRERLGETEREIDKYRLSEPLSEGYGGVPWILGTRFFRDPPDRKTKSEQRATPPQPQRLADAVANAGLTAAGSGWLRAVVLVLGEHPADQSQWPSPVVREYLRTLRVPLYVWSTANETQRAAAGGYPAWEPVDEISTSASFLKAVGQLAEDLGRQRILWVRGVHFLHDIRLASHVSGVGLAE